MMMKDFASPQLVATDDQTHMIFSLSDAGINGWTTSSCVHEEEAVDGIIGLDPGVFAQLQHRYKSEHKCWQLGESTKHTMAAAGSSVKAQHHKHKLSSSTGSSVKAPSTLPRDGSSTAPTPWSQSLQD